MSLMARPCIDKRCPHRPAPPAEHHCETPLPVVAASTTIVPVMCGCKEQKYSNTPGVVNVKENLSAVSSNFDLNSLVLDVTVWGMSSPLSHVTVVPADTVMRAGLKVKLSIFTSTAFAVASIVSAAAAWTGTIDIVDAAMASGSIAAASAPRQDFHFISVFPVFSSAAACR